MIKKYSTKLSENKYKHNNNNDYVIKYYAYNFTSIIICKINAYDKQHTIILSLFIA